MHYVTAVIKHDPSSVLSVCSLVTVDLAHKLLRWSNAVRITYVSNLLVYIASRVAQTVTYVTA